VVRTYEAPTSPAALVEEVLADTALAARVAVAGGGRAAAGDRIADRLAAVGGLQGIDRADVVVPLFFRGSALRSSPRLVLGVTGRPPGHRAGT
jgi:hypothetical protein